MKDDMPLRFKYKITASSIILMVLAAFAVTASIWYAAYANTDSRLTRFLSRFVASDALPNLCWGHAALTSAAAIYVLRFTFSSYQARSHVEPGPKGAFIPSASIYMSPITTPYSAIKKFRLSTLKPSAGVDLLSEWRDPLTFQILRHPK
jgi:hypothetical protein